jgi:hypothetical protein
MNSGYVIQRAELYLGFFTEKRRFNRPGFLSQIGCSETGLIAFEIEVEKMRLNRDVKGVQRLTEQQL